MTGSTELDLHNHSLPKSYYEKMLRGVVFDFDFGILEYPQVIHGNSL
jgi:hypothetical protein